MNKKTQIAQLKSSLHSKQARIDMLETELKNLKKYYDQVKQMQLDSELKALELIENAKTSALDSIYIVDDIIDDTKKLISDVEYLKKDIEIGSLTIEDCLNNFFNKLNFHISKLTLLKRQFYFENQLEE